MKLLLAVAGYPHSQPTAHFARNIAEAHKADTVILNVVSDQSLLEQSERSLQEVAQTFKGLPSRTKSQVGVPTSEILAEASSGDYDLLVIGGRERPSLSELVLGSVARKVVSESPISVLVVKGERTALREILIGTGGKRFADPTVQEGIELARSTGAHVTLLYVVMPAATMYTGLEEVDQHLSELLQTDTAEARHLHRAAEAMEGLGVEGELKLRHGTVVDEILREASLGDYDLIVLGGRHRKSLLGDFMWGDVTGSVLDRANRSVLVARGSSTGRWEGSSTL